MNSIVRVGGAVLALSILSSALGGCVVTPRRGYYYTQPSTVYVTPARPAYVAPAQPVYVAPARPAYVAPAGPVYVAPAR